MSDRLITVAIESPFATEKGAPEDVKRAQSKRNIAYALACMRHALAEGCSPYASHLSFTMILRDTLPEERKLGMKAGFAYADQCDERWICLDVGESGGMKAGRTRGTKNGQRVIEKRLGPEWPKLVEDIPDSVIDALFHVMVER